MAIETTALDFQKTGGNAGIWADATAAPGRATRHMGQCLGAPMASLRYQDGTLQRDAWKLEKVDGFVTSLR